MFRFRFRDCVSASVSVSGFRIPDSMFLGAIHSTKISGNFGPKLNGSVRSNRKSFGKTGPPFEVVLFSRSDRLEFWLNGSRPLCCRELKTKIETNKSEILLKKEIKVH